MVELVDKLSGWLWGPWMIVVLVGMGVYFTIGTKFMVFTKFPFIMKGNFWKDIYQKEGY